MKAIALLTALSLAAALAACSAEPSRGQAPQARHTTVDPSIPALTVSARRMTDGEKLAYDRSLTVNIAGLKTDH